MTAEEARNLKDTSWQLSEQAIKMFEQLEYTPYYTPVNISKVLTAVIDDRIKYACKAGESVTKIRLFNYTDFQGWQIEKMMPYLKWYYMKDGYKFKHIENTLVEISWEV